MSEEGTIPSLWAWSAGIWILAPHLQTECLGQIFTLAGPRFLHLPSEDGNRAWTSGFIARLDILVLPIKYLAQLLILCCLIQ